MEPDGPRQLIFLGCLLAMSAFFSGAETALTSLSRIRIRSMLEANIKGAHVIAKLTGNMKKLLSTLLVGNNVVNIAISSIATALVIKLTGDNGVALSATTALVTFAILVFGEITPKTIAAQNSEKVSLLVARPVGFLVWLLSPIVSGVNQIAGFLITLLGANPDKSAPIITEAELKTMVTVSHEQGVLEISERQMIYNVFAFGDSKARDIMTPRTDIVAIPYEATYAEIISVFEEERFSRMPVYRESTDHIVGILYFKDFMFRGEVSGFCIDDYMRQPFFTYESKLTGELFSELRTKRIPMAIVLDEYGGTAGLLTLEDLIEEIVGEISDEYDDLRQDIEVIKEDEYVVHGGAKIADVNEMIGVSLQSEDYESIGGYVTGVLGYIPKLGEAVESEGIRFIVEAIDKNRIEKLRIYT